MVRIVLALAVFAVIGSSCVSPGGAPNARSAALSSELAAAPASIHWDEWGVAHIEAPDLEEASYALGWAQMRARPDLVLRLLGQARGRAAEYWGEKYYEGDALMWTVGLPQNVDAYVDGLSPESIAQLKAFAQGINDFASAHPELVDSEMAHVLPVSAGDVLSHSVRVVHLHFLARRQLAAAGAPAGAAPAASETPGSNAWAVGPSRSASGEAMLLINPHLSWDGFHIFFETHIRTPEVNVYGAATIGSSFLILAFNDHLGWTHTVNPFDGADIYAFDVVENGYRDIDGIKPFAEETVALNVRSKGGDIEQRPLVIQRTSVGPVVSVSEGKALAVKIAGLEPGRLDLNREYWDMARANDLASFEEATSKLQMPMFNTIYADRFGDIYFLFNALMPDRATGDHEAWAGVLDGDDPDYRWGGYLAHERLPQVKNPPSGFVQNANEPPWMSTLPTLLDPADYPGDLRPPSMHGRAQSSLSLLAGDDSITFDEFVAYSHSTRASVADNVLDDLIAAARASGDPQLAEAADVLAAWDRTGDATSRGTALFYAWVSLFRLSSDDYASPWSFSQPEVAPSGLADPKRAARSLKAAANMVKRLVGSLDAPWGAVAQITRDGDTFEVDAAPGLIGAFRVGWVRPRPGEKPKLEGGTAYVAAVSFGDVPTAQALLPYGNFEERPPFVQSQWELFADGRYRDVYFEREDVLNAAKMTETLRFDRTKLDAD
ncbi:MAG: penicillin acylase family protein [Caulobacterales bacterium]|nr:penicillin acylase family protein [Caulobacterales bacterium]